MAEEKYQELLNCVKSNLLDVGTIGYDEGVIIMDNIMAENIKHVIKKLCPLLSLCFTGCLVHGTLPDSILAVLLVLVIKDKVGKLNSSENYRPIALASIVSKVLEIILMSRLERYILTADNQFGFKHKHSTDMCLFALKEILDNYNRQNTTMFLCFIDASKAFDRVNHEKMLKKLCERGVPRYLLRILAFWYGQQTMRVKWGKSTSAPFHKNNGVRQGGILSPLLFNIYMDDLSKTLNACRTGCLVSDCLINHLMYTDVLVIFSPWTARLQQLLSLCTQYGMEYNIIYHAKKSNILIVRSRDDRQLQFPAFYLSGSALSECNEVKYLGHFVYTCLCHLKDHER